MSSQMLQVDKLNAYYGAAQILFGVSIELRAGEAVTLLGANGAGKSTTLKGLMGLVRRDANTLLFRGQNILMAKTYEIARAGLAFVPEERRIFTDLTVLENLEIARQPARKNLSSEKLATWTSEKIFELFPNLAAARTRPASRMSGGEQQMLAIARALMGNPCAILLDEPFEGVAPVIVDQLLDLLEKLKSSGLAILLSEQNFRLARAVGERGYVLEKGQIIFSGLLRDLAQPAGA